MAATSDRLNITLRVDSAVYPISIKREDERAYRMAEKLINSRLSHYAQAIPGLQADDYLRRTVLDIALAFCRNQERNDTRPYTDCIDALTKEIEEKL